MFPKCNTISKKTKDFYISYNYSDRAAYGSDTTALVIGQMQRFYILNGDHRKAYSQFDTFEQCIEYFKANAHLMNKLSNQYDENDAAEVINEYKAFQEKLKENNQLRDLLQEMRDALWVRQL